MSDLLKKAPAKTVRDFLHMDNNNQGAGDVLKPVKDGFGNTLPFELSKTAINFTGDVTVDGQSIGTGGGGGGTGADGASAYDIWVDLGNIGTEQDFINSLQGADGEQGPQGLPGTNGTDGQDGVSAYQTWLDLGNVGTQQAFIDSLQGADGADGTTISDADVKIKYENNADTNAFTDAYKAKLDGIEAGATAGGGTAGASAYEIWLNEGNAGAEQDFLNSLQGEDGAVGPQGPQGIQGDTGETGPQGLQGIQGVQGPAGEDGQDGTNGVDGASAYDAWIALGNSGTEQDFINSLKGDAGNDGTNGTNGADGKSAYQVWLDAGNSGTEADFLAAIKGDKGDVGDAGAAGADGNDGDSAYQVWINAGNSGTETDFLNSLVGADGAQGPQGIQGEIGPQGPQGPAGADGVDGTAISDADVKIKYENNADTNAFTDAEKTKLAGIEEGATAGGGGGGSSGNAKELIASLDYNGVATTATSTLTWANPTDYETIEFEIFNVKGDWTTGSGSVQFADGTGTLIQSGYYTAYNHGNTYNGGGEAYAPNAHGVYYVNSHEIIGAIDEMQVYGRVMNAGSSSKSFIVNGYFAGTWTNNAHVIQTKFGCHNRSITDGITGLRFYSGHSTRKFTQMSIRVYGTKKVVA